ncbi:MAG: sigma-70 family RNA polymerase sigma factor [Myxococcales bacterium]|nr:sigma-70 family RNA polymerase sigma factor [Myxococcales bacterium]
MDARPDRAAAQLDDDHRFVYAVARRIVGDREAASDVAQDAMLQAFRHRASFRGDARYRTWLYRIATTAAFSHLRRERSLARRAAGHAAAAPLATPPATPIEALTEAETARVVADHVGALAGPYREILALRFYDDCTEREAATTLGVSEAAIKLRTHRAKRALRARLTPTVTGPRADR